MKLTSQQTNYCTLLYRKYAYNTFETVTFSLEWVFYKINVKQFLDHYFHLTYPYTCQRRENLHLELTSQGPDVFKLFKLFNFDQVEQKLSDLNIHSLSSYIITILYCNDWLYDHFNGIKVQCYSYNQNLTRCTVR